MPSELMTEARAKELIAAALRNWAEPVAAGTDVGRLEADRRALAEEVGAEVAALRKEVTVLGGLLRDVGEANGVSVREWTGEAVRLTQDIAAVSAEVGTLRDHYPARWRTSVETDLGQLRDKTARLSGSVRSLRRDVDAERAGDAAAARAADAKADGRGAWPVTADAEEKERHDALWGYVNAAPGADSAAAAAALVDWARARNVPGGTDALGALLTHARVRVHASHGFGYRASAVDAAEAADDVQADADAGEGVGCD